MSDLLFVYGTLMPSCRSALGRSQRMRLASRSRALGPAMMSGRLLDLGRFPGLVDVRPWRRARAVAGMVVYGDLLSLDAPAETFAWLDQYEGITPECGARCLYARDLAEVVLEARPLQRHSAHVYVYRGALHGASTVASGRWEPPAD